MSLGDDLLTIERDLWTGGPDAYLRHLEAKCLVAFAEMAGVMSKEDIAKTAEKGRWAEVAMEPKGVAELTGDSAVVSYICNAKRNDDQPYRALVSSGYVRRSEGWKLAFHQQTALKQAG